MKSKGPLDRREFLKTIAVGACVATAGMAAFAKAMTLLGPGGEKHPITPGEICSLANTDSCKACGKCRHSPQQITAP